MANYGRDVVERALDELGIDVTEQMGTPWAAAFCPLHDDTNTASLTINMEEGGWKCHAGCGSGGDLAYFIAQLTDEDPRDVRGRLRRRVPASAEALTKALADPEPWTEPVAAEEDLSYEKGRAPRYIFDRGFTADTLRDWGVGQDTTLGAVVIPPLQDRGLVGLVRRRVVVPEGEPKYLNTRFPKGEYLMGLDLAETHMAFTRSRVVVVEGPLDAMWLYQQKIPAVALLGSSMSQTQADTLQARFWQVVLAFDDDLPGQRGARQAARRLDRVEVLHATLPEGRCDVQECTPEEVADMFSDKGLTRWAA